MQVQASGKSVSIWKAALGWIVLLVVLTGSFAFWIWFDSKDRPAGIVEPERGVAFAIIIFALGGLSLVAGIGAYVLVIYTNCFMSDFSRPMWNEMRVRIYFANVFIPLLVMGGLGFMLSAFLTPVLSRTGMSQSLAQMVPIIGCIGGLQLILVWFVIWAPLEKRLIRKRLAAKGISEDQMRTGLYLGLSNPEKSSLKRFSSIEEDVGMLWFDVDQLIYWGDTEQFALRREHLIEMERKMDGASTTALSGTAHVILRVRQPDGSERRIRLHCEGVPTLGGKRTAMNQLAERITAWAAQPTTPPPIPGA